MTTILTFHGAARAVTGSCFRLQTGRGQILIDCGLFQGSKTEKELNYRPFAFQPEQIDAVILSHAHIDHSGLLPKMVRDGYSGPIHATAATRDLAGAMLPDSAHIQDIETRALNRRTASRRRRGQVQPIYTGEDAEATLALFQAQEYDQWFQVLPDIRARLWNAGHMLGSASIELLVDQTEGPPLRLLFSADIGPDYKLLHPQPEAPAGLDYVVCESTYGDTDRANATAARRRALLRDEVRDAINPEGALLIPSFAVERAQELISDLAQLMAEGDLPRIPVYVDSPLATRATEVFARHSHELEGGAQLMRGLHSDSLNFTESVDESIALDQVRGFHIVIAASGMCEAGRIRHRLKNWLWRPQGTVLFVGYQAVGTLGRILLDGARAVRIQGQEYDVRARIRSIDLYSGHADGPELATWVAERLPIAHDVFLVHGEPEALAGLAARLDGVVSPDHVLIPRLDESYELTHGGAVRLPEQFPPRIPPEQVARLDWHNEVSRLFVDLNDALTDAADEKARNVLIRRLRRALDEAEDPSGPDRADIDQDM